MLEEIVNQSANAVADNWGTIVGSMVVATIPHSTRMYAMMALHGVKKLLGRSKRIYIDDNFTDEDYKNFRAAQGTEPEIQVYVPAFGESEEVLSEVIRSATDQNYSNKKIVIVTSSKDKNDSREFEGAAHSETFIAAEQLARKYEDVTHIHVPGYGESLYGQMDPEVSKFLNSRRNPGMIQRLRNRLPFRKKESTGRSLGVFSEDLESMVNTFERNYMVSNKDINASLAAVDGKFAYGEDKASYNTLASALYRNSKEGRESPNILGSLFDQVSRLYHTTYFDKEKGKVRRLTNQEVANVLDHELRNKGYNGKKVTATAVNQMLHAAEAHGNYVAWKRGSKHEKTPWDNYLDHLAKMDHKLDMKWADKLSQAKLPPRMKPGDIDYAMMVINGKNPKLEKDGKRTLITILDAEDSIVEKDAFQRFNWAINHEKYDAVQGRLLFAKNPFSFLGAHAAADYAGLFRILAPDTVAAGAPLTLSGTSYALSRDAFYSIGILDPYNQTEDAMAGMILSANDAKVALVKTHTLEEAPTDLFGVKGNLGHRLRHWSGGWIAQRRRWAYGFGQSIESVWKSSNFSMWDKAKMSYLLLYSPTYSAVNMAIMPLAAASLGAEFLTDLQVPNWVLYPSLFTSGAGVAQMTMAYHGTSYSARMAGFEMTLARKAQIAVLAVSQPAYWFVSGIPPAAAAAKILDNNFEWSVTEHKGAQAPMSQETDALPVMTGGSE